MRVISILLALCLGGGAQEPAPRLNLVIVEGEGAINNIRQRTARETIVQVEDENHKPVAGAAVVFLLPNDGPGATFANGARSITVMSDQQGRAVARGLRPNNVQGQYQIRVTASKNGQTASATITQSNVIAAGTTAASSGVSGKLIAIVAVAGAAVAAGVIAATRGGGNNTTANTVTTITPGTGTVGPPR